MNLQDIDEELNEESSLQQFAMESLRAQPNRQQEESITDSSVDLREFPNAEFYFKLVAKVNDRYYSIYDGNTEYMIGRTLSQRAQDRHQGGYYVYSSLKEAIFADIPYNTGGHYIAPRTVLKVIAWGDFVVYDKGKMSFSNIMPVQDLGLPMGYKSTKESIKNAMKEQEERKLRPKEVQYDRNLVRKNTRSDYENDKFENYFGQKAVDEIVNQLGRKRTKRENYQLQGEIQDGLRSMIADIENRYR